MGGIWGAEPNGDTYLWVGLDLLSGYGTLFCSFAVADFAPTPATRTIRIENRPWLNRTRVHPPPTWSGLSECQVLIRETRQDRWRGCHGDRTAQQHDTVHHFQGVSGCQNTKIAAQIEIL